jgi:hypothetical protein
LLVLDDAMESLAQVDPRQSRIVELRYFGGLSIEETAQVLEVSPATVKREWSASKHIALITKYPWLLLTIYWNVCNLLIVKRRDPCQPLQTKRDSTSQNQAT